MESRATLNYASPTRLVYRDPVFVMFALCLNVSAQDSTSSPRRWAA